jgi:hypothetical protein
VEWSTDGNEAVRAVRYEKTPRIDSTYIDSIFGIGKNGVRDRSWLRFVSGHLNIETLRVAICRVDVDGSIFGMLFTVFTWCSVWMESS